MSNKMKELRQTMHLTQKQIADFLKIPVNTYRQYEAEERKMSPEMLIKIADFYHVSIDELLLRNDSSDSRYVKISADEHGLLIDYRASDAHDKQIVKMILHHSGQSNLQKNSFQKSLRFANRGAEETESPPPSPELLQDLDDLPDVPDDC